ncbi:MAG: hypothetical protein O2900_15400 [Proteobacteria bacterium]|nr:hypothetical protein [Pseudomonadota bacterium]
MVGNLSEEGRGKICGALSEGDEGWERPEIVSQQPSLMTGVRLRNTSQKNTQTYYL